MDFEPIETEVNDFEIWIGWIEEVESGGEEEDGGDAREVTTADTAEGTVVGGGVEW